MSITAMKSVWKVPSTDLAASERLVLLNLASHAHHDGSHAFPAVGTIATETALTRRAVQKILHRLERKRFIAAVGTSYRGSVRYALDLATLDALATLDRERRSQSEKSHRERSSQSSPKLTGDCEPDSQLTANVVQGGANVVRGGANVVRGGGEPGSPDPSLNRQESSEKKVPGAAAPVPPSSENTTTTGTQTGADAERDYQVVKALAGEVCREQPNIDYPDHVAAVRARAGALLEQLDDHRLCLAVTLSRR
jgi:DNA-binding MarR family transcriptional regulator